MKKSVACLLVLAAIVCAVYADPCDPGKCQRLCESQNLMWAIEATLNPGNIRGVCRTRDNFCECQHKGNCLNCN